LPKEFNDSFAPKGEMFSDIVRLKEKI